MSTPAQIAANTANAQSSTGPRTEAGRAKSSKNSTTYGLFSGDFIRPGEETDYAALSEALESDLAPVGVLEEILSNEIQRASWRLRRCGQVESNLVIRLNDGERYIEDPMEATSPNSERIQKSVDRARSQAHRLLYKATAELRKLQTERQYRNEIFDAATDDDTDTSTYGLADWQSITKGLDRRPRPTSATQQPITQRTQSQPAGTPRNTPCPCGSGEKHKRCCGKNAPAVLGVTRKAA